MDERFANKLNIPKAVIRRLPQYYRLLGEMKANGIQRLSSQDLAKSLRFTASQVRQDLNHFGGFGQQGYGYNVSILHSEIGTILGISEPRGAVLIGAGNLGKALLKNFSFEECGFRMLAAFDIDPEVVGREINGVRVFPLDVLEEYTRRYSPSAAMLTIPADAAEAVFEQVSALGFSGVLNFTSRDLVSKSSSLVVENVRFEDSLMTLRFKIK